jgi:hypothetical protein
MISVEPHTNENGYMNEDVNFLHVKMNGVEVATFNKGNGQLKVHNEKDKERVHDALAFVGVM